MGFMVRVALGATILCISYSFGSFAYWVVVMAEAATATGESLPAEWLRSVFGSNMPIIPFLGAFACLAASFLCYQDGSVGGGGCFLGAAILMACGSIGYVVLAPSLDGDAVVWAGREALVSTFSTLVFFGALASGAIGIWHAARRKMFEL